MMPHLLGLLQLNNPTYKLPQIESLVTAEATLLLLFALQLVANFSRDIFTSLLGCLTKYLSGTAVF